MYITRIYVDQVAFAQSLAASAAAHRENPDTLARKRHRRRLTQGRNTLIRLLRFLPHMRTARARGPESPAVALRREKLDRAVSNQLTVGSR